MRGYGAGIRIGLRLFFFGVFTSIGYLLYGIFLSGVQATVLTFNSFAWLFIIQCFKFEGASVRFRWPFRSISVVLPSHLVGFAACQFAYWFLFWYGAASLRGAASTNFAPLALGFLSLNTLATPLAMHFARRDQMSRYSVWPFIGLSVPLALGIVLIEADMTWHDFSARLNFLDGIDANSVAVDFSSPAMLVIACILLAVIAEAVGDFLLTRRDIMKGVSKKKFVEQFDEAAYIGREADSFAKTCNLPDLFALLIDACRDKFEAIEAELRNIAAKQKRSGDSPVAAIRRDTEARFQVLLKEANDRFDIALQRLLEVESFEEEFAQATPDQARMRVIRQTIVRDYYEELYEYVENRRADQWTRRMKEDVEEAAVDLMAILGLFLSSLLLLVDATRAGSLFKLFPGSWQAVVILCLLGLTGSSARPLFLLPLLKRHAEALIPPIYAVRPLIYFGLGWLLLKYFDLSTWIKASFPEKTDTDVLPHFNVTYALGAILAVGAASGAWWIAYRRSRQRPHTSPSR
jgi:hypothetical protein